MTARAWSYADGCAIVASMVGRSLWLLLTLVLAFSASCGRNIVAKELDEPCTRTEQCETGLECKAGVCLPISDAGVDGGS